MRSGKVAEINERVLGVKIWYEDGRVVRIPVEELADGWKAAPRGGVQVVAIYDRHKFELGYYAQWYAGYDYYALSPTLGIVETNLPADVPHDGDVKFGSQMDKDDFRATYNKAMQDHEF